MLGTRYNLQNKERKGINSSYHNRGSRTSFIRNNVVHFDLDEQNSQQILKKSTKILGSKQSLPMTTKDMAINRSALKRSIVVKSSAETRLSQKSDHVLDNLARLDTLRLPTTIRNVLGQTTKTITKILNSPIMSRSSIVKELKCFMSNSIGHDSYLITKSLAQLGKQKLRELSKGQKGELGYDQLAIFIKKVQQKCWDSDELLASYLLFMKAYKYPVSVELMTIYIGVYLFSINSHYVHAQDLCKKMLDMLLKHKLDEFIGIYLILMIKLKTNQSQWQAALPLISRALAAAWVYKLQDLQIWCYFQFSRCYFSLGDSIACEFFKWRSQMSVVQSQQTIFRQMVEQEFIKQLELMRNHNYYFNLNTTISYQQLTKSLQPVKSMTTLKAQVYAKVIAQNFKIKHVKNLIGRLGEDMSRQTDSNKTEHMAGNPQFLTHQSGIKNLNVYFRIKQKRGEQKNLYTFENSNRNTLVLKEMMRNLLLEMKWFAPIVECEPK